MDENNNNNSNMVLLLFGFISIVAIVLAVVYLPSTDLFNSILKDLGLNTPTTELNETQENPEPSENPTSHYNYNYTPMIIPVSNTTHIYFTPSFGQIQIHSPRGKTTVHGNFFKSPINIDMLVRDSDGKKINLQNNLYVQCRLSTDGGQTSVPAFFNTEQGKCIYNNLTLHKDAKILFFLDVKNNSQTLLTYKGNMRQIFYDNTKPEVELTATSSRKRVYLSWQGSDSLSGIAGYTLQYKEKDANDEMWPSEENTLLYMTQDTEYTFEVEEGKDYEFRVIAYDNLKNKEYSDVITYEYDDHAHHHHGGNDNDDNTLSFSDISVESGHLFSSNDNYYFNQPTRILTKINTNSIPNTCFYKLNSVYQQAEIVIIDGQVYCRSNTISSSYSNVQVQVNSNSNTYVSQEFNLIYDNQAPVFSGASFFTSANKDKIGISISAYDRPIIGVNTTPNSGIKKYIIYYRIKYSDSDNPNPESKSVLPILYQGDENPVEINIKQFIDDESIQGLYLSFVVIDNLDQSSPISQEYYISTQNHNNPQPRLSDITAHPMHTINSKKWLEKTTTYISEITPKHQSGTCYFSNDEGKTWTQAQYVDNSAITQCQIIFRNTQSIQYVQFMFSSNNQKSYSPIKQVHADIYDPVPKSMIISTDVSNKNRFYIYVDATDKGSGLNSYKLYINSDTLSYSTSWTPISQPTILNLSPGTYTLRFKPKDNVGNIGDYSNEYQVTIQGNSQQNEA